MADDLIVRFGGDLSGFNAAIDAAKKSVADLKADIARGLTIPSAGSSGMERQSAAIVGALSNIRKEMVAASTSLSSIFLGSANHLREVERAADDVRRQMAQIGGTSPVVVPSIGDFSSAREALAATNAAKEAQKSRIVETRKAWVAERVSYQDLSAYARRVRTEEAAAAADVASARALAARQAFTVEREKLAEINRLEQAASLQMRREILSNPNSGLRSFDLSNLSFQLNDILTMAAMGSSPMSILASQSGQIFQIIQGAGEGSIVGGLQKLKVSLMGLVTPINLAFGGGAALIGTAAYSVYQYTARISEARMAVGAMSRELAIAGNIKFFDNPTEGARRFVEEATKAVSAGDKLRQFPVWFPFRGSIADILGPAQALTGEQAGKAGGLISDIRAPSQQLIGVWAELSRMSKEVFGDEFADKLSLVATALKEPDTAGRKLIDTFDGISEAEKKTLRQTLESADVNDRRSAVLRAVIEMYRQAALAQAFKAEQNNIEWQGLLPLTDATKAHLDEVWKQISAGKEVSTSEGLVSDAFKDQTKAINDNAAALQSRNDALRTMPNRAEQIAAETEAIVRASNPASRQLPGVDREIEILRQSGGIEAFGAIVRKIENPSGDPNATSSAGAKGNYQFMPSTWAQYGAKYGSVTDPAAQEKAFQDLTADNKAWLTKGLGRQPTLFEQYLAHNQGAGGAVSLLRNPNSRAGSLVGDAAIKGNFGGDPDATAAEFVAKVRKKFESTARSIPALTGDDSTNEVLREKVNLQQQILDKKADGSVIDKAELAIAERSAAGAKNAERDQADRNAALEKQIGLLADGSEKQQLQLRLEQGRAALADRIFERRKADAQIDLAKAVSPEQRRDAKLALNRIDVEHAGTDTTTARHRELAAEKIQIDREYENESKQVAAEGENTRHQIAMQELEAKRSIASHDAGLRNASNAEQFSIQQQFAEQRLAIEREHQERLKAIWGEGTAQYRQAQNQLVQIDASTALQRANAQRNALQQVQGDYQQSFNQIGSSVSGSIMGMIQGTMSLRDAARNVLLSIVNQFVQAGVRMVTNWLASTMAQAAITQMGETQKTAAVAAGASARMGLEASASSAGMAQVIPGILKSIFASAAQTFAGIFGFLSPIMGPAAAGPAVAGQAAVLGAAAGLASFDVGSWELPGDMIAKVHKGEMIVPAGPAAAWRQALNDGPIGGGGGQVAVNHATHINISAIDGQSVRRHFQNNERAIMRQMADAMRRGVHLGLRQPT